MAPRCLAERPTSRYLWWIPLLLVFFVGVASAETPGTTQREELLGQIASLEAFLLQELAGDSGNTDPARGGSEDRSSLLAEIDALRGWLEGELARLQDAPSTRKMLRSIGSLQRWLREELERIDVPPSFDGDAPLFSTLVKVRSDQDRYDLAKQVLEKGFRAYVSQDLSGFMRMFSRNATMSTAIVRNAIQEDFQQETGINVDLQIIQYIRTMEGVRVELLWNRVATDQATGVPRVERGNSLVFFDRDDEMRVSLWQGSAPFGRRDPQMRAQVQAGAPNDETGIPVPETKSTSPSPTPSPTPSPPVAPQVFTATVAYTSGSYVVIDFDARTTRLETPLPTLEPVFSPLEDWYVYPDVGADFSLASTDPRFARVAACAGTGVDFLDVRGPTGGPLLTDLTGSGTGVFVGTTEMGKFVVVEVTKTGTDVSFRWRLGDSTVVHPGGSIDCP